MNATLYSNLGENPFVFETNCYRQFNTMLELNERFSWTERYLTYVTTDKPIYRPGDTLYYRGWILHAHNQMPLDDKLAEKLFAMNSATSTAFGKIQIISPSDTESFNAFLDKPGKIK